MLEDMGLSGRQTPDEAQVLQKQGMAPEFIVGQRLVQIAARC